MNKKGEFTIEEFVRIVIAVMVILILIYLAFSLYGVLRQQSKLKQAQIHLETIERIIKNLEEGSSDEYLLTSPKGWFLTFFSENQFNSPLECGGKECLCFCEGVENEVNYNFDCDSGHVCRVVEEGFKINFITTQYEQDGKIVYGGIRINPSVVYISKQGDVLISHKKTDWDFSKSLFNDMLKTENDDSISLEVFILGIIENKPRPNNVINKLNADLEFLLEKFFDEKKIKGSFKITKKGEDSPLFKYYHPFYDVYYFERTLPVMERVFTNDKMEEYTVRLEIGNWRRT
ncbi:MAG: hypothetical protein U9Q06_00260 [Nanoarchaeota archaeon]|nr:hypothetical protein [Nanoarchaeota archaeon]